jgi:SNF2 family DNA or RNA helicase
MIISPSASSTDIVAKVRFSGSEVLCSFKAHDEAFRKIVKGLGYSWAEEKRAWHRVLNVETNGEPIDRAAELVSALVNAGFGCEVDETVADLVVRGAWKPEQKRWVKYINGRYVLSWRGQEDDLYHRALMLPEAAWDSDARGVAVPAVYFGEVIGFAEEHGFEFTRRAQESLEESKRAYQRIILPEAPKPKAIEKKRGKERMYDLAKFADLPSRNLRVKTDLLPHQIPAVEKILPLRVGALFMDMGTGKTRCAIELVARRQERVSRVIWFCPVSLKLTVAAEIQKHTEGETIHVFDNDTSADNLPDAFWYVVGIESMSSSDRVVLAVNRLIDEDTFVIVDESSYIKGHASKRSTRITELSARARYRLLLTGTPITQGVVDLYAQMRFLSPDILGYSSFYSFARKHLEYSEKYPGLIVRTYGVDEIVKRIEPFVYQVTKEECMSLPDKLYDQIYFGLTDEQWDAYQQAKDEIINGILDEIQDYIIFQLFTALQQIVSGFWNRNGREFLRFPHRRVETLKTALSGIPECEKVIIWCKYVESVRQIAEALDDCALYYGDLSEKQRDEQLRRFRGDCRYLVATQATGGHGLTLNEAHYHVFYENEFKYSHRVQAEDRSHRIGQTAPVTYIDIVANAGIDKRIQEALSRKQDVVRAFRDEVKKERVEKWRNNI